MNLTSARTLALRLLIALRSESGQAMVEYSSVTFFFLVGFGGLAMNVPLSQYGNQSMVQALYAALQTYVDSVFYCLSLSVT